MCCTVWELASDDALHDSIKGGEPIMQCEVEGLSGKAVQVGSEEDVGTGTFSDSSHRNQTGPGILPPSTSVVVGVAIARSGVWYDESGGHVYCHLALLHAPALVMRIMESEGLKGCLDAFLAVDYLWGLCYEPCGTARWIKWIEVRLEVVGYVGCHRCLWLWWRGDSEEPVVSCL